MSKALIVYAHPAHQRSRANQALLNSVKDLTDVTIHDLYEVYPNFFIDVPAEQALLEQYDLIVIQHPVYWYNMPALLREWQDLVLEYGFAYGKGTRKLAGKGLWVVLTAGAPEQTYEEGAVNERPLSEYFLQYNRMANVCGMQKLESYELYYGRHTSDADLNKRCADYRANLLRLLKEI